MKRITIKDIAKDLNLHHSTVSRALRGEVFVNEETRKKVLDYAKMHGYQINMSALQLRGSVRNTIAILVPNIHHSFFSNIVSIITNLAFQKGYVVSVFQSNENLEMEKEIVKTLIRNNVAGVIASVSMETVDSEHLQKLKNYRIPLVLFDRVCPDVIVPKVTVNNSDVVAEALSILVKRGFKRIVHISGTDRINVFRERQAGYLAGIRKHKLGYSKIVVITDDFTIETGKAIADKLFSEAEMPDAFICDSHFLTLGVMIKVNELGMKVPEEIGLAGFGDNPYVNVVSERIISIVQPDEAIAHSAFDLIMKKIENADDELTESFIYSARIIER